MDIVTRTLYVASAESVSGKSAIAVGLLAELCARGGRVGVFRPIVQAGGPDPLAELLHPLSTSQVSVDRSVGVTYDAATRTARVITSGTSANRNSAKRALDIQSMLCADCKLPSKSPTASNACLRTSMVVSN